MKLISRSLSVLFSLTIAGVFCCSLVGCGGANTASPPVTPPPIAPPPVTPPPTPPAGSYTGVSFGGKVTSGSVSIVGASVQLYAAGSTGLGSAGTSLLTSLLTTDAAGSFIVPAGYYCPAASSQLYIVVRGGQVGSGADNAAITLATALGVCSQLAASSQFVVNEVTTVATAWGLAQFLSVGGNVGATSTNAQGLANAVATVTNLANLTKGTAPGAGFPATGASPAPRINSLANLLNTCTAAASVAGCGQLFSATTPSGGTAPTNTLDAVLNLVRNPGANAAALYTQSTASKAFAPALNIAPADWTLFINYSGGGMSSPAGLSIDATGNVWVANYGSVVSEFTSTGSPLYAAGITSGGVMDPYGIAMDPQNNVWVANETSNGVNNNVGSVSVFNSAGQVISGTSGYSIGGLNYPKAIAIDTNSTAWVVNYGDSSVTLLSSTGQPLSGAKGYTSTDFQFPVAVAIDANHNGWVANYSDGIVTKVTADGSQFTNYSCCNAPAGVAIDQRGYVWVANYLGDSISQLASDGTVISTGYSDNGASILHPQGLAIDGAGHVWVANYRGPSLTELAGTSVASAGQILSPPAGYAPDAALLEAWAIAVDASGNLWVTNFATNTLTEIIGLAVPVKTPQLGPVQAP